MRPLSSGSVAVPSSSRSRAACSRRARRASSCCSSEEPGPEASLPGRLSAGGADPAEPPAASKAARVRARAPPASSRVARSSSRTACVTSRARARRDRRSSGLTLRGSRPRACAGAGAPRPPSCHPPPPGSRGSDGDMRGPSGSIKGEPRRPRGSGRQRPGAAPGRALLAAPRRPGPRGPARREGTPEPPRLARKGPQGKRLQPDRARASFPPSSGLEPSATTSSAQCAPQPPRSRGHPGCACRRFPCGWPRAVPRRASPPGGGVAVPGSRSTCGQVFPPRVPESKRTDLATPSFDRRGSRPCTIPDASRGGTAATRPMLRTGTPTGQGPRERPGTALPSGPGGSCRRPRCRRRGARGPSPPA